MSVITNSVFRDTSPNAFPIIPFNLPLQTSLSPASHESWSMRFNKNATPIYVNKRNSDFSFRGNDFTIETWVNVDAYNTTNTQTGDTNGYCIFSTFDKTLLNGLYITLKVNKGNNIVTQQTAVTLYYNNEVLVTGNIPEVSLSNWFHISLTRRDSVQFILHINGKMIATTYKSVDIVCPASPSIGSFNFTDSNYATPLAGYLASFRISNIARYNNVDYTINSSKFVADSYTTLLLFQSPFLRDESSSYSVENYIQQGGKVEFDLDTTQSIQGTYVTPYSPYSPTRNYTPSIHGGSMKLDGSSCIVAQTANFNFSVSSWSMEMWFRPDEISEDVQSQTLFSTYGGFNNTSPGITVGLLYDDVTNQPYLTFDYIGQNTDEFSKMYPLTGYGVHNCAWSHISFVYKNNTIDHGSGTYSPGNTVLTGYVNGRAITVPDTSFNFDVVNSYPIIGASTDNGSYTDFFKGYIAGVRFSNVAVKNDVICTSSTNWLEAFTPKTTPPTITQTATLLLNFDNLQSYDKSGKNCITLTGQVQDSNTIKKFQASSYYLNGSSSFITVTPSNINELIFNRDFTIETWIYCESVNHVGNPGIFQTSYNDLGYSSSYSTGIALFINSTNSTYVINMCNSAYNGNISIVPTNAAVLVNTWQHIAITRNNGQINFFLNGSKKQTTAIQYEHPVLASALCIGGHSTSVNSFKGYIDNFRVTKDFARYTESFVPPSQPFSVV